VARPTLTRRTEHQIAALVATGVPLSTAARIVGVPPATVTDWFVLGRKKDAKPHWRRFSEAVEDARREHRRQVMVRLEELRGRLD
jgi:hypothetical protein